MDAKQYIDALFSGYEETPALADFKEELQSNLNDRINSLINKGLEQRAAFDKAISELGDISVLADEISLKRKQEVIGDMYMKTRNYMSPKRAGLYVLSGVVLAFGIITALITWFAGRTPVAAVGALLPFSITGVCGLVFLALTQETASHEAMPWKRAVWYVVASGVFLFGIFTFVLTYFATGGLMEAIATLIPFFLPGLALGIFLLSTETDRSKPWVQEIRRRCIRLEMERFIDPAKEKTFGLISGALWIGAITVFILLCIMSGLKFSWLAIAGALILQLLITAAFSRES
jgi:hypothetical protein